MKKVFIVSLLIIAGTFACRQEYDARVVSAEQSFLVVEANLNPGADSTIIRLTRTFKLDVRASLKTENNAIVTIEGKDNSTRALTGTGNGYYVSPGLNLTIDTEYRLRIKTNAGGEYVSEYVKARVTPLIDSISWEPTNEGVWIYANTHDVSKATRYYRWEYDGTWEIRSKYYSFRIYVKPPADSIRVRNQPEEEIFYCWKYDTSTALLLANSTRLQDDIIYKTPIQFIPRGNERLSVRYSIQVRQYALERDAYNFYELMKKNTENIGSIFSAQPFELQGNMKSVNDPSEYVMGFVTASTVDEKRIFINYSWLFSEYCPAQWVPEREKDSIRIYFNNGGFTPIDYDTINSRYLYSFDECVDCRERHGSLLRPSFW